MKFLLKSLCSFEVTGTRVGVWKNCDLKVFLKKLLTIMTSKLHRPQGEENQIILILLIGNFFSHS